jgi:death-on-curing protein
MRTKNITLAEIEYTAFKIAEKFMLWGEPLPEFGTRFPNVLESCIETPFQKFNKKHLYKALNGKGAILFYLMIKNHPFKNGNKRLAVMGLLYFLAKNNKWLEMSNLALYNFAKEVAESDSFKKDSEIKKIEKMIQTHMINF